MEKQRDEAEFYAADLGRTFSIALTNVAAQQPDTEGPIPEGRYLVQILDQAANRAFVGFKPFVKTEAATVGQYGTFTAAVPYFPMDSNGIIAFEINIVEGHNDRIQGIMVAGTATLLVTLISREKLNTKKS